MKLHPEHNLRKLVFRWLSLGLLCFTLLNCQQKKTEAIRYLFNNDSLKITNTLLEGINGEIKAINDSLLMFRDSVFIKAGSIKGAPKFESASPLLNALYRMSVRDLQMLYLADSGYFVPSTDTIFNQKCFTTREVAIASDLSLAYFMPNEVITHLRTARELRLKLRFQHPTDGQIDNSKITNKAEKIDESEFVKKFGTLPILKQTDDIVWVLGWSKVAKIKQDRLLMREMIELFDTCNSVFYQKFYDDSIGLYRGQALFVDVAQSGYPYNLTAQQCANLYALSTNCLYVSAFDNLANACKIIGENSRSVEFAKRASALRDTICSRFKLDDGSYAYFLYSNYRNEQRNDLLGSSLATLYCINKKDDQFVFLRTFPKSLFGVPQLNPPYTANWVQNNSVQPYANAYFNRARFNANDKLSVLSQAIAEMGYLALNKNFCQSINFADGSYQGYPHYLCSSAANLSVIFDLLLGIKLTEKNTLTIEPCIPIALEAGVSLSDLKIGISTVDISITGSGTKVKQIKLNEKHIGNEYIVLNPGKNSIEITMTE